MSRIGKKEIIIPENVVVCINNNIINITGQYGTLIQNYNKDIEIIVKNNKIFLLLLNNNNKNYYGLMRSLIQNMIIGVNKKFKRVLILEGVGYKFKLIENNIYIYVGFTHVVKFNFSNDISIKLDSPIRIQIEGINIQKVTQFAAQIYNICPPEPYKGKGILFENQKIIKKIGKKGK